MNDEEKKKLKQLIVMTAAYYREALEDEIVKMYAADLEDLSFEKVSVAFLLYRRNARNRRSPLPADIRSTIAPPETDEDVARDAATRIIAAVGKRGYYWALGFVHGGITCWDGGDRTFPSFEAALTEEVGGVGARAVAKVGGWGAVHQMVSSSEVTVVAAQLRELALSIRRRVRAGTEPQLKGERMKQISPGIVLPIEQ